MSNRNKGFTLIELLIIIGIIGFLAAAILVAVDPVRRIQEARDSKRWSEVNSILNAYLTKQVDDRQIYLGDATVDPDTAEVTGAIVIPNDDDLAQVIVYDPSGVDCGGANTVECGDVDLGPAPPPGGYAGGADYRCIADLSNESTVAQSLTPEYIAELPLDPRGDGYDYTPGDADDMEIGIHNTGYYILMSGSSRITIGACHPERVETIKVTR